MKTNLYFNQIVHNWFSYLLSRIIRRVPCPRIVSCSLKWHFQALLSLQVWMIWRYRNVKILNRATRTLGIHYFLNHLLSFNIKKTPIESTLYMCLNIRLPFILIEMSQKFKTNKFVIVITISASHLTNYIPRASDSAGIMFFLFVVPTYAHNVKDNLRNHQT